MREVRECLTVCAGQVVAFSTQVITSLIRDVPVTQSHAFPTGFRSLRPRHEPRHVCQLELRCIRATRAKTIASYTASADANYRGCRCALYADLGRPDVFHV